MDRPTFTTRTRVPRRQFLRGGLVLTGSLMIGGLLQACGNRGGDAEPAAGRPEADRGAEAGCRRPDDRPGRPAGAGRRHAVRPG